MTTTVFIDVFFLLAFFVGFLFFINNFSFWKRSFSAYKKKDPLLNGLEIKEERKECYVKVNGFTVKLMK